MIICSVETVSTLVQILQKMMKHLVQYGLQIVLTLSFILPTVAQESNCGDGLDNDGDGLIDCADSECYEEVTCETSFPCMNDLYQVISSSLKKLDPLTGIYEEVGRASSNYNGAGFNVQDGFIYGLKSLGASIHLWKIDNTGRETDLGPVEDFQGRTYVGDFDKSGNHYTYKSGSSPTLYAIDVDAYPLKSIEIPLTNLANKSIPGVADLTYNPQFEKFFGMSAGHELIELDPKGMTARIVGDFSSQMATSGGFGAAWSDIKGNSYFSNNNSGQIFRITFDVQGNVSDVLYVATGQPTNSNDGMGCFNALPAFELNCQDGLDDDGDGLIDCRDPDCANAGICPYVSIEVKSIVETGPSGVVPFYLQIINPGNVDAPNFDVKIALPIGFSFLADTLEYLGFDPLHTVESPTPGTTQSIKWTSLNLPKGDTVNISFSVLVNQFIFDGWYQFDFGTSNVIQQPYEVSHDLFVRADFFQDALEYNCAPAFYQVYKKKGAPNTFGKLDPQSGDYEFVSIIDHQANGLGYDVLSGFVYGAVGDKFIRMDAAGNIEFLNLNFDKKVFSGDADEHGFWYGKVGNDLVKVDLSSHEIVAVYEGQALPGWDMATNIDGHLYSVHKKSAYRFNTQSLKREYLGELIGEGLETSGHGAQWTGSDGYHYISNNSTGKIFRVDVNRLDAGLSMLTTPQLQFNDGFSCPTSLPVVFSFEYGDYAQFPLSRNIVYSQDINEDDIPDFGMIWLGDNVSYDLANPSNEYANGDEGDDGLFFGEEFSPGVINKTKLIVTSNSATLKTHWGVWIDWDLDGDHEDFYSDSILVNGQEEIIVDIKIPIDFTGQEFAVRARTSTKYLSKENFDKDILEPGEIEDYILTASDTEFCANGIDDNYDGLVDCDDPLCYDTCEFTETGSTANGGLESNGHLLDKINKVIYDRARKGQSPALDKDDLEFFSRLQNRNININSIEDLQLNSLMPLDIIEDTETYVNTPNHLMSITNATEILAVDIFESERRVAAVLALRTEEKVYEHTKFICDRLTGSEILDVFSYPIDGASDYIIAKLMRPNGNIEYALSFSIRDSHQGEGLTLESHWDLNKYTEDASFINFQIWANSTRNLFLLFNEVQHLVNEFIEIKAIEISEAPGFFIQSGQLTDEALILKVNNKEAVEFINIGGNLSASETSVPSGFSQSVSLSGAEEEVVVLNLGSLYYAGLSFTHPDIDVPDFIFYADGSWGASTEFSEDKISNFEVSPDSSSGQGFPMRRSISIDGLVQHYVTVYRSISPGFLAYNFDEFGAVSFDVSGRGILEVAVLKQGIDSWEHQGKVRFELTSNKREVILGKEFFESTLEHTNEWNDVNMIVFNIIGDGETREAFELEINQLAFTHDAKSAPYLFYSSKNLIAPRKSVHRSQALDGTDFGSVVVNASLVNKEIELTLENSGEQVIFSEDAQLEGLADDFSIIGFEPAVLDPKEKQVFSLRYAPEQYPKKMVFTCILTILVADELIELPIEIKVDATCPENDKIEHPLALDNRKHFKATHAISSEVSINAGKSTYLSANESVVLNSGLSVEKGGVLMLMNYNNCKEH